MDNASEKNTNAVRNIGVYTYKDPEGKLHPDKRLEVLNEPQADALHSVGYVYDAEETARRQAEREKAAKDFDKAEAEKAGK